MRKKMSISTAIVRRIMTYSLRPKIGVFLPMEKVDEVPEFWSEFAIISGEILWEMFKWHVIYIFV